MKNYSELIETLNVKRDELLERLDIILRGFGQQPSVGISIVFPLGNILGPMLNWLLQRQ